MVETLPPPISLDHDLALSGPSVVSLSGSHSPVGQVLVDAPIGGVSHEDPHLLILRGEGDPSTGLIQRWTHATSKRRLSWLDLPQVEPTEADSFGQLLLKRRNIDFLLGGDMVVVDIPDDDTPKQL